MVFVECAGNKTDNACQFFTRNQYVNWDPNQHPGLSIYSVTALVKWHVLRTFPSTFSDLHAEGRVLYLQQP